MKRVLTGTVLVAAVLALIFFNLHWLTYAVSAVLALLAALEFRGLALRMKAPVPVWWLALAIVVLFTNSALGFVDPLALVSLLLLMLFTASAFSQPGAQAFSATGAGLLLLVYVAFPLSLIPRILAAEDGTALLLFLLLCVWCGDIAALYIGKAFGRHKLAPSLSPNKTWEGSVASVAGSLLFGMAVIVAGDVLTARESSFTRLHTSWPWWAFALLAVLLNVAAQVGDLAESALKRGAGVKDSGTLLPGHGGVLDRIDALLFAAPVLWFVLLVHAAF